MSGPGALIRPGLRFAAVGHVTNDLLASGPKPGGSAFYATLAARALGAEACAVTCFGADWSGREQLLGAGVKVIHAPSPATSCFENLYVEGRRRDRLISRAADVVADAPADAQVVLACPVIGEVPESALSASPGVVLGAGLQGWLRTVGPGGEIGPRGLADLRAFRHCRAVFLSEHDLGGALESTLVALQAVVPLVVLTRGAAGSILFEGGRAIEISAAPARELDPTGAGDVYATAFLLALASGQPPVRSARVASWAAARAVEAPGAEGLDRLSMLAAQTDL